MKSSEKVSSKEVGLEVGLVISRFLYKTEHLHYGYWPDDLEIIPENVRKAQDLHSKLIIDSIPDDVETILDIGSGSGGLAEKLIEKGFNVHCVSPSDYLADAIEEKLGDRVKVYRSTCQDLELEQKYDLVIFSESFQYSSNYGHFDSFSSKYLFYELGLFSLTFSTFWPVPFKIPISDTKKNKKKVKFQFFKKFHYDPVFAENRAV